jgi:hypothetical protein
MIEAKPSGPLRLRAVLDNNAAGASAENGRLPSPALDEAATIHDPAQLWFAFAETTDR